MTKRKTLLIFAVFLIALTSIRLIWITLQTSPNHPAIVQGQLDLREWDIAAKRPITLSGQWEFYPKELLMGQWDSTKQYTLVPGNWNFEDPLSNSSKIGYGTYRLRIAVPDDAVSSYGIRVQGISTSSALFVNGKQMGQSGIPAADEKHHVAGIVPYSASFPANEGEIEIVLQVANYHSLTKGGITNSILFGEAGAVQRAVTFSEGSQLAVVIVLVIHAIYAIILFSIGARQKLLIYFTLLIVSAIFITVLDDHRLLLVWSSINYEWNVRLLCISFLLMATFLIQFIKHLMPEYVHIKAFRWYAMFCLIYSLLLALLPFKLLFKLDPLFWILIAVPFIAVPVLLLRTTTARDTNAVFLLLGATALSINFAWGIIKNMDGVELNYYPIDMIAAFIALATFWFRRYFQNSKQTTKLAEQLQEAHKHKDDFLANTSHELRNPLHGMLNIAQSVLEQGKDGLDAKNTKNLELLITVGNRMSLMLNDLLDLSRLKESGTRLQISAVPLQTIVSGVCDMLRFMTEGKPIRLINAIPNSFPNVIADEDRLIQILFNLMHNAVKYTIEGTITIHAAMKGDLAEITIEDTGIGMDENTQQRIFLPYEQGDSGITAMGGGLGIGLSICKQLVELHGGTISVQSEPGQGSVFTFSLHLADYPAQMKETSPLSLLPVAASAETTSLFTGLDNLSDEITFHDRPRVMVVDDDNVNLQVIINMLPGDQYEIVTVTNATHALEMLDDREWDLVISDVMMPHISGYELSRHIRQRYSMSELPILLLTARSRPEDIATGFRSGANDYVTKPVDPTELRSRVSALTELKRSVRERLRMEAAWLQAQIQPHFLFNTLNSIAALSEIDSARMLALLDEFSNYLRASFDFKNSEQLVPLEHELGLVRSYLYIEKERFHERLQVEWQVAESIEGGMQVKIPPLSIQPLVENATRHGILKRKRGGKIVIKIEEHPISIEIAIIDDGVGIQEDRLQQLLNLSSPARNGIGLINIDRRLKQLYGQGLHIASHPDLGTTVRFTITK
ncbi:response regulator [Paenibacillaceae bacterium]|nr:response regulator [Paenibacillaceae bacterium]